MSPGSGPLTRLLLLFLIALFTASSLHGPSLAHAGADGTATEMRPAAAEVAQGMKSVFVSEEKRRRLVGFQICALCTCCGGPRGICLPSPCCYAINCNIPNRPFGFCAFTPKSCDCFGCHL